jgi:hypothetical protein
MEDQYHRVRRRLGHYREQPLPAAVPRKFGIGTLLVVSAAYAVLFGVLRGLNTPGLGIAGIALFLTAVGIGQMVFGQRAARIGSIVTGTLALPVVSIAMGFIAQPTFEPRMFPAIFASFMCMMIPGALCGYVGGVMVAGVFLAMETAERWIQNRANRSSTGGSEAPLQGAPRGTEVPHYEQQGPASAQHAPMPESPHGSAPNSSSNSRMTSSSPMPPDG